MGERFVGLVRVSTERQGESRLGLEAGLADIREYAGRVGGELVAVLEEVGSGGHDDIMDRPTLLKALTLCKRHRACLLVPKVDRLLRSTVVHADLKRSGVPLRAADNPAANEFTFDVLVAVAAEERRQIASRVRKSLAVYKAEKRVSKRTREAYPDGVPSAIVEARAGKLGSHLVGCHLTDDDRAKGRAKGNARQRREAVEVYADLIDDMRTWRSASLSLREIAARLNATTTTRTGASWTASQVHRTLRRASRD